MSELTSETILALDLFMMCETLNREALRGLPAPYSVRYCRPDELEIWKRMHFDNPADAEAYNGYMTDYFQLVYAPAGDLFFRTCRFVCNEADEPIATAFMWRAYGEVMTLHWLKVLKAYEGEGIGRGLLSIILSELEEGDFPVFLHTHPSSFRAIKLYADFGFCLLSDPVIGARRNDLVESWPILQRFMPQSAFEGLTVGRAPARFLQVVGATAENHF